jgi:hypothetical protein
MEPAVGIEPTTDGLQNRCSTTELRWLVSSMEPSSVPRRQGFKGASSRSVERGRPRGWRSDLDWIAAKARWIQVVLNCNLRFKQMFETFV